MPTAALLWQQNENETTCSFPRGWPGLLVADGICNRGLRASSPLLFPLYRVPSTRWTRGESLVVALKLAEDWGPVGQERETCFETGRPAGCGQKLTTW